MNDSQIRELVERYNFELVETHISWVLIGDKIVYKIKKPVDFGFLDYTSLGRREYFCKKEVELNSRLAREIYLGVSKVCEKNGTFNIDGEGKVVDFAVKMRRLNRDHMMDVLIAKNLVSEDDMRRLARTVAEFHVKAQTNDYIKSFSTVEANKVNTDENFEQTKRAAGEYITDYQYSAIKSYTNDFYSCSASLFERRIRENKIRDCHGDMYSRNICIERDKIFIYDCIEFNERFRYSDVANDVAFLLMDLENMGRYDLSEVFLKYYLEFSGDKSLLEVLDFYKIYRAYVRGKIAYFQERVEEARGYFDLAFGYLPERYKPVAIAFVGFTGVGKSFLAEALSGELEAEIVSSDVIRKKMAGVSLDNNVKVGFGEGIYSYDMTLKVYETMAQRAYDILRRGKSVILDATFLTGELRRLVSERLKKLVEVKFVWIDADERVIIERLGMRGKSGGISDGRYEIYVEQKRIFEVPREALRVDATGRVDENLKKICSYAGG